MMVSTSNNATPFVSPMPDERPEAKIDERQTAEFVELETQCQQADERVRDSWSVCRSEGTYTTTPMPSTGHIPQEW